MGRKALRNIILPALVSSTSPTNFRRKALRNVILPIAFFIFAFLFIHIINFFWVLKFGEPGTVTINGEEMEDAYTLVAGLFTAGGGLGYVYSGIYIIGFIALIIMLLISYTRSRAELEGVKMAGIGFMERGERYIILIMGYIIEWTIFAINIQYHDGSYSKWFFSVFFLIYTVLCLQTLLARIFWTYKWLNNKMPEKVAKILAKENQKAEN